LSNANANQGLTPSPFATNISDVRFFISLMNAPLTHRIDGDGPTILLLNGGLMSIAAWETMMPRLTSAFRVVRFDFRGQLLSPGPARQNMQDHASDVAALLDHLGMDDVHLVGASFGAEVALLVAARHPDRVRSLTCITATDRLTEEMVAESLELRDAAAAAAGGGDGSRVFEMLAPATFSEAWLAENAGFIAQRRRQFAALPRSLFEGLSGLMSAFVTLDLERDLKRISAPTLVLAAELDAVFPVPHSEALAGAIEGARLEVVDGVGHGSIVEAPDRVLDRVIDFVSSVEQADTTTQPHTTEQRGSL